MDNPSLKRANRKQKAINPIKTIIWFTGMTSSIFSELPFCLISWAGVFRKNFPGFTDLYHFHWFAIDISNLHAIILDVINQIEDRIRFLSGMLVFDLLFLSMQGYASWVIFGKNARWDKFEEAENRNEKIPGYIFRPFCINFRTFGTALQRTFPGSPHPGRPDRFLPLWNRRISQ